jgi:hypothetical protein
MKFKIIKATFKVKRTFKVNNETFDTEYLIEIERKRSGASKYGDQSVHILSLYNAVDGKWLDRKSFDTRYDRVPLTKKEWVKTWKKYFLDIWCDVSSIELIKYREEVI